MPMNKKKIPPCSVRDKKYAELWNLVEKKCACYWVMHDQFQITKL